MSEKKSMYMKYLSKQIDLVLTNKLPTNNQIMIREDTPKILVENGIKNLPMLITQRHIRTAIFNLEQARTLNLPLDNKTHYHGLGKELFLRGIKDLENPIAIYKNISRANANDNFVIITNIKDNENNNIIIPIQVDGRGIYNNIMIKENQIKSIYGKKNINEYVKLSKLELVYKKRDGFQWKGPIPRHCQLLDMLELSKPRSDLLTDSSFI